MSTPVIARTLRQLSQRAPLLAHVRPLRLQTPSRCLHQLNPPSPLHQHSSLPSLARHVQRRHESTTSPRPLTDRPTQAEAPKTAREEQPSYEMTFTCRQCVARSTHRISKQGYHHGTILITCPGCKARHLISDHLRIFSDSSITLEDILRDKGQLLKKGVLGEGDVEFWDDGSTTAREKKGDEGKGGES